MTKRVLDSAQRMTVSSARAARNFIKNERSRRRDVTLVQFGAQVIATKAARPLEIDV